VAETTVLSLRPTRLIALHYYVAWIFLWILSALTFLDPTRLIPDWRLGGFRLQSYGGALLGILGLFAVLYAEIKRRAIRYTITDERVIRKDGILRRKTNQMPFTKIERIQLDQGILQRIFKFGDIVMDTGEDTITLESVGNVELVQDQLSKQVGLYAKR
jgi:uncharacterized membrane protein YdbT with pleckstrin-like domain